MQFTFIVLRLAVEERLVKEQLGKNAADSPNVDSLGIMTRSQQQLWCAIPPEWKWSEYENAQLSNGQKLAESNKPNESWSLFLTTSVKEFVRLSLMKNEVTTKKTIESKQGYPS